MSLVFDLPSDVCTSVLSVWLQLRDLAALDSAVCNRLNRIDFLKSFEIATFVLRNHEVVESEQFQEWIFARGIAVDTIKLHDNFTADQCSKFVEFV